MTGFNPAREVDPASKIRKVSPMPEKDKSSNPSLDQIISVIKLLGPAVVSGIAVYLSMSTRIANLEHQTKSIEDLKGKIGQLEQVVHTQNAQILARIEQDSKEKSAQINGAREALTRVETILQFLKPVNEKR